MCYNVGKAKESKGVCVMRLISFYKIKNKKQVDACILSMKNRINFQSSYDHHINSYSNDIYLSTAFTSEADKKLFERIVGENGVEIKSLSIKL